MSKETEKIFKQMHKELEGKNIESDEQLDEEIQKFISKLNEGEIDFEETPEMESDDLLFEAYDAPTEKQAIKIAEQALEIYPDNIDAENLITSFEIDSIKKLEKYEKTLERARKKLEKEDYFDEENIGSFYGILETRPFMRTKHSYMLTLMELGRYTEAMKQGEELIELCENDNLGIRYLLVTIYILLEKFGECEKLYNKYRENSASMIFPMAIMYYKKGDYKKSKEMLKLVRKSNKYLLEKIVKMLISGQIDMSQEDIQYYQMNSREEANMVISDTFYLLATVPNFMQFIKNEIKK